MFRIVNFKIPEGWLRDMDKLVKAGVYPNRSTLIRDAVRLLLKRELWNNNHDCNGSWRLKTITLKVSEKMLEDMRRLVEEKKRYCNVADLLRFAAMDLLERERNLETVTPVTSLEPPKRINPEKYLREVEEHG